MSNRDLGAAEIRGIFARGDLWWPILGAIYRRPILDVLRPGRYAGAISRRKGTLPLRCVGGNGTTHAVTQLCSRTTESGEPPKRTDMNRLNRVNGVVITVLGIVLIVVALVVLNGLGGVGTGHTRADVFFALGVIFIVVGAFVAVTRP